MTSATSPDIVLRPATTEDVELLAAIADDAFKTDTHTQLKVVFHGPAPFRDGMTEGLRSWLQSTKVDLIVAEIAGEPVGWAGWGRRGFAGDVDGPLATPTEEPVAAPSGSGASHHIKDLESLTNASMEYWMGRLMPEGCRCRFVVSCVVHPEYQGRGVGGKLMRWGTDKADGEPGVYGWVQSSMGAVATYEKYGFHEVGRLEADLDVYAEGKPPGKDYAAITGSRESWGRYTWIYMKRD
ncbi:hypothetical protein Cob_v010367 [Colletotrichum orbiculare MAFF 240422]|uniref:N-acetyltransferase domain-containing protein n=1 Tax=Colletotrichum orbiculare (strain 104-T / ATCC 96160 / CBS 514.97 / LARS 414 / MAFF 240422) TaxID=1213857 RepID=A0A484FDZ5_COLOR|nr:hypothetical protein Cob_v010367 [Colletotrichum orbiculare MAFF 240422]